jgi:hypothetical protein
MKFIFITLWFLGTLFTYTFAQPQAIPFQGAARNATGEILSNKDISLRLSILDSSATGPIVYSETHSTTTSLLGLFVVHVGQGNIVTGTFSQIDWGKANKYLSVELDTNNGTAFMPMGITQMLSVPYALYSNSSGTKIGFKATIIPDTLPAGVQNLLQIGDIEYNDSNGLDSSGFTAPQSGLYNFNISIFWSPFPSCTPVNVLLIKDSVVVERQRDYFCTGSIMNSRLSAQLYLLAGEKIKVGILHNQSFTQNSMAASYISTFSGFKIY